MAACCVCVRVGIAKETKLANEQRYREERELEEQMS
jgi:hypothetical protein